MDLGAGRRGVDMGPSALRLAGLNEKLASLGYEVEDLGNVSWSISPKSCPSVRPTPAIFRRSRTPARGWREWWRRPPDEGRVPLVLGGDHSVAMGTVAGMSQPFSQAEARSSG